MNKIRKFWDRLLSKIFLVKKPDYENMYIEIVVDETLVMKTSIKTLSNIKTFHNLDCVTREYFNVKHIVFKFLEK